MTQGPLVSVIVPSYNYGHFLPETLASVRAQTWQAWECLVVDDGSTDDTAAVVRAEAERDARIKYVHRNNGGLAAARNTGLAAATGDYVQLLDADDALEPRKLEAHVRILERERDVGLVYGGVRYFDSASGERRRGLYDDNPWMPEASGSGATILRPLLLGNIMVVSSPLVRRAIVDRVGGFDTSLRSLEDWDYWLRCAFAGAAFRFVDENGTLALVRVHSRSMSQNRVTMYEEQGKVRRRLSRAVLGEELYRLNRSMLAVELAQLGNELAARGQPLAAARSFVRSALTDPPARGLDGIKRALQAILSPLLPKRA